ncbi:hypothetical protein KDK_10670 [Dictyobacter kobayashii]|uniref:Uncharacterized protein n=1 Tax=Dictyobacter kobayashii TaxID=2014872 RepID=A0A402ADT0_9CHLR|nr:hypothetical protein KDK_10670 [Dictyobacter kobayashii]
MHAGFIAEAPVEDNAVGNHVALHRQHKFIVLDCDGFIAQLCRLYFQIDQFKQVMYLFRYGPKRSVISAVMAST